MNKVFLSGTIVSEIDLTDGGSYNRCSFRLKTVDMYFDKKTGVNKEIETYHSIVTFNKDLIEALKNIGKNTEILISGRLNVRGYTQDDVKRYVTEVVLGYGDTLEVFQNDGIYNKIKEKSKQKSDDLCGDEIPF